MKIKVTIKHPQLGTSVENFWGVNCSVASLKDSIKKVMEDENAVFISWHEETYCRCYSSHFLRQSLIDIMEVEE